MKRWLIKAADFVRSDAPDMTWVYLEYSDDMGASLWYRGAAGTAVRMTDDMVGRKIWDAMEYRRANFNEDWQIYITTDHGRDAHGERAWPRRAIGP